MARQQRRWEDRGKELAAQMTDAAIAKLQEEFQEKQARLGQLDKELEKLREAAIIQELTERSQQRSQLQREVLDLEQELTFIRDAVKPKMVQAAGRAGWEKDSPKTGCFG